MSYPSSLTIADLQALFAGEVVAAGGTVSDTFADGSRLFTRSILPRVEEVRPKDRVQGGVALRATLSEVWVHPYVFRQVCRNGAIMAQALQTRHLVLEDHSSDEAAEAVREAIGACCADEAFTTAAEQMRSAQEVQADAALNLLPWLSRFPEVMRGQFLTEIMSRFFQEPDRSRFALMNAVTSLARDTRDPELRWRLEELGGGIPAEREPGPRPEPAAAREVLVS